MLANFVARSRARPPLLMGLAACGTPVPTPASDEQSYPALEEAVRDRLGLPMSTLHLVWGRVVPDIPAFCRELVAALADE